MGSSFFLFELKIWLKKKGLLILFSLKDFKTEYHKTIVLQVNRDNNDDKCMLLPSVYHRCRDKFGAKINAKFSQLSRYYVAKKCDNKRDIAFFCTFYKYRDGTPSKKL